jgi:uncharacterized protein (TIGR02118 family)
MTVKLVALYRQPENVDDFLNHYKEVHLPLVAKTPHLQKTVIGRITGSPMGAPPYFLMAEMFFPDADRFQEAMRSPENRAAGKDLMSFAADIVTLIVVEEQD